MATSRERLIQTLNHQTPDQVCADLGGTLVTSMAVVAVSKLRKALLGDEDYRVKVVEPYQMLGEIDDAFAEALGIDVEGAIPPATLFGFENKDWKPFALFDGTEVLVPGGFNLTPDGKGGWFIHPEGDTGVAPSGHLPKDGFYFDSICRQEPIVEDQLDPADNLAEFGPVSDTVVNHLVQRADAIAEKGKGCIISLPGTGFGDIALVPAPWMKETKGIRDVQEWYVSLLMRRNYVYEVFERQCEIALANLARLAEVLGDKAQAAFVTGTDFGTQRGPFTSVDTYRDLFKPFHEKVNAFIHEHTQWKTFIHSCGGVYELIPEFIEAGFDILNPVQCSAAGMDAMRLKREFGRDVTFWGGVVDTQQTLPFGTPDEVYEEVRRRIGIFNEGGGFVFNAIHNIQANTPVDNMVAMFNALRDSRNG